MKTLLISIALMFGITMAGSVQSHAQDAQEDKAECTVQSDLAEADFGVNGLCSMCKTRIEKAAKEVNGVKKAEWNQESKNLTIRFDEDVEVKKVHKAIAQAGHDTEEMKASDEAYASLPNCCKYRDE
ncbi:MAG: heavy-metal-associated domain-containing protein [Bacteroidales bacterium]